MYELRSTTMLKVLTLLITITLLVLIVNGQLYPPIQPYNKQYLQVSKIHRMYYEEGGNPNGNPVVFIHGGPGLGATQYPICYQVFDPKAYRIILYDQRGCGKSTPSAAKPEGLEENTTWDLVEDLEKLRRTLGIDKWILFGGSWGSTLSLAYAQTYPSRVKAMILRGIFLLRRSEMTWLYQQGASDIFPDFWQKFIGPVPPVERFDMMSAYNRRLMNNADNATMVEFANAWAEWEDSTSHLIPQVQGTMKYKSTLEETLQVARIENHYFVNGGFLRSDDQLLKNSTIIRNIPGVIVQGRYDMVCPIRSAYDLSEIWEQAEFKIIPDAGHSMFEKGILSALIEATEKYKYV